MIGNKWIPLILLPLGGWTVDAAIQGVLVTGAAVYSIRLIKQLKSDKEINENRGQITRLSFPFWKVIAFFYNKNM